MTWKWEATPHRIILITHFLKASRKYRFPATLNKLVIRWKAQVGPLTQSFQKTSIISKPNRILQVIGKESEYKT